MLIGVVVHPVDTFAHPSVPPGWRYAVHLGSQWSDLGTCLNAGWAPDKGTAAILGEGAAVVGVRVAQVCGDQAHARTFELEYDPIPAGRDLITVGG